MSTFTIPNSNQQIRQINDGEVFGELSETFNIDLTSSKGKIKVSNKLVPVVVESPTIEIGAGIFDILIYGSQYYIIGGDEVFRCSVNNDPTNPSNWTEVTGIADLDGVNGTAVIFDGLLLMSHERTALIADIMSWDGSSDDNDYWTNIIGGENLRPNVPHILEVVQSQKETLFVADGNRVHYVENGGVPQIVELDSMVVASCMAPALSGSMWVGTFNENSGNAYVYEIYVGESLDSTPVYRQAYQIDALAVLAIWTYNNTPYIVTEQGNILVFNGAGFVPVADFPFRYSKERLDGVRSGLIQDSNRARPIHPRGVKVHNDSVYININTSRLSDGSYAVDTRSHSGIWEFNMKTGVLNHRFGFANDTNTFGDSKIDDAYPILVVDNEFTFIMAGGTNTSNLVAVYMNDFDAVNQGYFVTPEIMSGTVTDAYDTIYHKAKTLVSDEEIVTQYRATKRDTVYGDLNWTSTTSFNTLDDWESVQVGELVRISHGYGAGDYANIVSIEKSTNTYTIVVDRPVGAVGELSYGYSDNFLKDPATYTSEHGEYRQQGGYGVNPWIQFMIILRGDIEYRQFICKGNSKNER